jgi:hypothetical protein
MRASQVMALKNKIAVCAYNNVSRRNSVVYTVSKNGSTPTVAYGSPSGENKKETIGYGTSLVKLNGNDVYIMPSEDMNDPHTILYVDWNTGHVGEITDVSIRTYSCVSVGAVAFYASSDSGSMRDGWFYNAVSKSVVGEIDSAIKKPNTPGIVVGMIKIDNEYLCACDDDGLYLSDSWHRDEVVTEVNKIDDTILAFYRNGKVKTLEISSSGIENAKEIGDTELKARRSCLDTKNKVCYWTTSEPQQLWVTNGKKCKKLHDFGPHLSTPTTSEGSAFSSAVAITEDEPNYVYVVISDLEGVGGWKLYKVKLAWCV